VLTLLVNIFFIPIYGFKASAIATLLAYSFMMVASFILGRIYYPIPYNFFKIGVVFSLSILFSILHFYSFRENYIIGGAFILIMSLVILNFEKHLIKKLLKS
jgi:O-antigen/teichoic acid export membrane protein